MKRAGTLALLVAAFAPAAVAHADAPARAVILDTGTTMQGRGVAAETAVARSLLSAGGGAPVALVTANDSTTLVLPPTRDAHAIDDAVGKLLPTSGTAHLLDATKAALAALDTTHAASRTIMIIASGRDAGSRASVASVVAAANRSHTRIDALTLTAAPVLTALTTGTHGSATVVASPSAFAAAGAKLLPPAAAPTSSAPSAATHTSTSPSKSGSDTNWGAFAAGLLLMLFSVTLVTRRGRRASAAVRHIDPWLAARGVSPEELEAEVEVAHDVPSGPRRTAIADSLELAGSPLTPETFVGRVAIGTVGAALVAWAIVGILGVLVAIVVVPFLARTWLRRRVERRRSAFADLLAETVGSVAAAMRAGHGLSSALSMVSEDCSDPMKTELRRVVSAERLGVPLDEALDDAVRRTDSRDLAQLSLVAVLQREVGGNGAEALDRIVDTIRNRDDVRRLVKSLTAQGVLSRWVLTCLPVGLAVALTLANGEYMAPMWHTTAGELLTGLCVAMIFAGSFWIKRVVAIDV